MKRGLSVCCLLVLAVLASCRSHRGPETTQEQFGVSMARMDLWREALFRFKRAVELSPNDAQAHNNLAVAYEANGEFDAAAKEYREAMRLDKSNQYIQKNYSRLVEFQSRNKKRQRPPTATATQPASAPAATSTSAAVPATTTAPPGDAGPAVVNPGTPAPAATAPTAAAPAAVSPPQPNTPPPAPTGTMPPPPPDQGDL